MNDQAPYSLYYAMLLQEYQQHGTALNGIDPSIVEACQHLLHASTHITWKTTQRFAYEMH